MADTNMISLTIGGNTKRSKSGQHPVSLDWNALPDASQAFIIQYGLKQYLADGMAGAENEADAKTGVEARVAKLLSGDLSRTKGEAKDRPDTEGGRALANAKAAIRTAMKAANVKADKDAVTEAAKALVESDPQWLADAKAELAKETKMATALDLTALIAKAAGNA